LGFEPIGRRNDYYRLPDGSKLDAITFGVSI
jgi:[ribosomal protein S18]-alanine N-acetyltransferase